MPSAHTFLTRLAGDRQPAFSLDGRNDTSSALDLLRWGAAQAVCVGHAFSFFEIADNWRPPFSPYMQNLGVVVFFVLSGFLIAYTLERAGARVRHSLSHYLLDRFARIYTALIPRLLFIAVIEVLLVRAGLHSHPDYVSARAFFGTLMMLQGYPNRFGSPIENEF